MRCVPHTRMAPWPFSREVNASGRPSSSTSTSSSSPGQQDPAPVEGFRLLQSLGDTALGNSASYESVGAWGVASLVGSAGLTGAATVLARSRTKPERDLPPGTHARAAGVAFKALGVATAFTGVATGVVLAGAWALGIDSAESLRRGLRGATRDAIAATGADGISRSQKQRQGR